MALFGILAVAISGRNAVITLRSASDDQLPVVATSAYHVSLFTSTPAGLKNPDSVAVDGDRVFIDYQNVTSKTGGDGKFSTVVEYNMGGHELGRWNVSGHSDGMRIDPATHLVWTTSNEDGNPTFALIDTKANTVTAYTFPSPTPHGGGYDDLYFLGGKAYVAASNPSLDASNVNNAPAVDQITLNANHTISLKPILTSGPSLNLTDPDSLSTDSNGDLVLVDQGDSLLVTIANPGAANQSVSSLTVGTQLDDTVFPSGAGRLLVVDAGGNTYWIAKDTAFAAGSIYTQAPNDSGVSNFVGTIDPSSGLITPFAVGFTKATGMVFVPGSAQNEGGD